MDCNAYNFDIWLYTAKAKITLFDVTREINAKRLLDPMVDRGCQSNRIEHVRRIAWFVVHGWEAPITVKYYADQKNCVVIDGNHRVAAAIYLNNRVILARLKDFTKSQEAIEIKMRLIKTWKPGEA